MALRLRIPRLTARRDAKLETRIPYMEEWVERLPYADTLQVVRQLFEHLRQLNRAPLKASLRLDLLESLTPAVHYLLEAQTRRAELSSTASFERNRTDTDGARQVAQQLAYGYKRVLVESAGGGFFTRKKTKRLAAQRACQYSSLVLAHAYHEYLPTVEHVWREIGEIFEHASDNGYAREPSEGLVENDLFSDSVERTYLRSALLALIDPLKLGVDELWTVHRWLGTAAQSAGLKRLTSDDIDPGLVVVQGGVDSPPERAMHLQKAPSQPAWTFDPAPCAKSLEEAGKETQDPHWHGVAKRCASMLLHRRERGSERIESQGLVEVASGLKAVAFFIGGDVEGEHSSRGTPAVTPPYKLQSWEVVNRGVVGYNLRRPAGLDSVLMVGDILGIRSSAGSSWAVGVVRWLSIQDPDAYRIGVEVLGQRSSAIDVLRERTDTSCSASTHVAALLLPGHDGAASLTLIAPADTTDDGEIANASSADGPLRLRITRTIETIGSAAIYSCEAV